MFHVNKKIKKNSIESCEKSNHTHSSPYTQLSDKIILKKSRIFSKKNENYYTYANTHTAIHVQSISH